MKKGGDPNADVVFEKLVGFTPITLITSQPGCIPSNVIDLVKLLIHHGADVNKKGSNGLPPIIAAAQGNLGAKLINLYKEHNVDVNALDDRGYNVLMSLPLSGKNTINDVRFWIDIGVDPSLIAPDGHSALKWIKKDKYPEAHKLIRAAIEKQKK